MTWRIVSAVVLVATVLIAAGPGHAAAAGPTLLVVLEGTGAEQDGLPVVRIHPDAARVEAVLHRGYSGRLLRLYHIHQVALAARDGRRAEPAYLLFSDNQGGFPRFGFVLDGHVMPQAGYVDLQRSSDLAGTVGALDQIFPHELLHVIVRQLAGERRSGGSSQVHAIGVRTDPEMAFEEGFAEHGQVMAIDAPDAEPATRAIASDTALREWADARYDAYAGELKARFSFAAKPRMTFPLWFGRAEQTLRYHGVRENRFAHSRPVPPRLLRGGDPYAAYLFENVVPGRPDDPPKPFAQRLATEGVIAALFVRWMREPAFRAPAPDAPGSLDGLDHAYLKIFHALGAGKPSTTLEFLRAYRALYPGEAEAVDRVALETLGPEAPASLGATQDAPREIWLRNDRFLIGTTVYDQYRGLPRPHTFGLNAASLVDLVSIPGLDPAAARAILGAAPFATVDDLRRVPGLGAEVARQMEMMAAAAVRAGAEAVEQEAVVRLDRILLPFVWRALAAIGITALLGGIFYRVIREIAWWRAGLAGLGAAIAALPVGWIIDPGSAWLAFAAPVVVFGVPGAAWRAWRTRSAAPAWRILAAWIAAALPSFIALRPWF